MGLEINTLYRFEGFEMDPVNRVFRAAGKPIAIPSRAFDLLLYMARNTQRLLAKEELMKAVWGDTIVEEGNLTQSVFLLRKVLSTNQPAENKLIVTVPGRGYRFAAQVEQVASPPPSPPSLENTAKGVPVISGGPLRRRKSKWFLLGAVVAIAAAVLVVYPGRGRRQRSKPVPMPHPVTRNTLENSVIAVAISPSGTYLAYADPQFITLRTVGTAETSTIPFGAGVIPTRVVWCPDETRLLVSERINDAPGLFVLSILSGKLSPLRDNALNPAVSPDGGRVVYSDGTIREMWLMDGNGENPVRILTSPVQDKVYPLFWSPDGRRVWFARVRWDKGKEIISLETCDPAGGHGTVALVSDTRVKAFRLLPGGRLIYAIAEGAPHEPAFGTPPHSRGGRRIAPGDAGTRVRHRLLARTDGHLCNRPH
jgi:DNA-binding winged helix-turn-helix (wHTH) protein